MLPAACLGIHTDSPVVRAASSDRAALGHCALIRTVLTREDALSVKSTGSAELGLVNVAVTGLNVPIGNPGIVTFALVAETTVSD